MYYVYILKLHDGSAYVGSTEDLKQRLRDHNQSKVPSTRGKIPARIAWYCAFTEKSQGLAFERYLKSGSGTAFRRKRLTP
ncbi:MAG: GIY-YIG nuclease family protein [Patescibacteria group bacterium]